LAFVQRLGLGDRLSYRHVVACSPLFICEVVLFPSLTSPEGRADSETPGQRGSAHQKPVACGGEARASAEANGSFEIVANSDCRPPSHTITLYCSLRMHISSMCNFCKRKCIVSDAGIIRAAFHSPSDAYSREKSPFVNQTL
jgi:hypothetical protein